MDHVSAPHDDNIYMAADFVQFVLFPKEDVPIFIKKICSAKFGHDAFFETKFQLNLLVSPSVINLVKSEQNRQKERGVR